jgi:NADH dehydrogenase
MATSRVAVIGASGFIGRYVVKHLAARGAVISAIGRDSERASVLQPMGDVGQIAFVRASLTDEARLAAALQGVDAIVNLAGIMHERGKQTFEAVHREGPARLGRIAKAAGIKHLVHVSAIGASTDSASAYARSKAAGEIALRAAYPAAVILRPSIVFGPEDDFFNRFAGMVQRVPALPLIGGGATRFQPVYVGDVAEAVARALEDPAAAGGTYELGGPRIYTFRALMELLLAETRRRALLVTLPWGVASLQAALLEIPEKIVSGVLPFLLPLLPAPLLTRDQVRLLKHDNVVSPNALTLSDLGIAPTAVEAVLPGYMEPYSRGGWFGRRRMEA